MRNTPNLFGYFAFLVYLCGEKNHSCRRINKISTRVAERYQRYQYSINIQNNEKPIYKNAGALSPDDGLRGGVG